MTPTIIDVTNGSIKLCRQRHVQEYPTAYPGVRPFLKWTGGKQWLAPIADVVTPGGFDGVYHEPFLGGGAFFFSLAPKAARLSDLNSELIDTYATVRDHPAELVARLGKMPYNEEFYLKLRARRPRTPLTRAVRLLYLNKTSFNGIYRVNADGQFNVPFGRYSNPTICQPDRIGAASRALQRAHLSSCDFESALESAVAGDFVYLDPPYITGHRDNGFVKYNARLFSWEDQVRLASTARRLAATGVWVLVSNADHPKVWSLYSGFSRYLVQRRSLVGGTKGSRGIVREVLLANFELGGVPSAKVE